VTRFGSTRTAHRLAVALVFSAILHGVLLVFLCGRPAYPAPAPDSLKARLIPAREAPDVVAAPLPGKDAPPLANSRHAAGRTTTASARERPVPTATGRTPGKVRGVPDAVDASAVALTVPRDPTWYSAKQLDELPRPLHPIRPTLPHIRDEAGAQGRVVLQLLIDENGVVTEASVLEAEPADDLAASALAAGRATRFRPGSKGGRIVKSRVLLELTFGRGDAGTL